MITLNSRLIRRLPILGILLCPGTPRGNGVEREGQAPAGRSAVGTAGASWAGCGLGGSAGTATHAPRPIEKDRHCDDPTRAGARGRGSASFFAEGSARSEPDLGAITAQVSVIGASKHLLPVARCSDCWAAGLELLATYPVRRAALEIHDCEDSNAVGLERVKAPVWKATEDAAANFALDLAPTLRMLGNRGQAALNLVQESAAKPGTLKVVVLGCFVQFALGELMEGDRAAHLSLARAARITSRAGLPTLDLASHSLSRRSASSAHSLACSWSASCSRLSSSFSASFARALASSLRASASMSSILMPPILPRFLTPRYVGPSRPIEPPRAW